MRFVICDDDDILCSMVDSIITKEGHDLVGIADTTTKAVGLVRSGRPDVVVLDPSVGINSDFDVIDVANREHAKVIVFSRSAQAPASGRYQPVPTFVEKPDLEELEHVIVGLQDVDDGSGAVVERRKRPARAPAGPPPTGPTDAAAFYSALNESEEGDALVTIAPRANETSSGLAQLADRVHVHIRATDCLLLATSSVVMLLLAGGEQAIASVRARFDSDPMLRDELEVKAVVINLGETPADAFNRLRRG